MSRPRTLKPAYCRHNKSGRAFVKIDGHFIYLGDHGTQESKDAYDRVMGEWIARGRPSEPSPADNETDNQTPGPGITVAELVAAFLDYAADYYSEAVIGDDGKPVMDQDGKPTRQPAGAFVNHRLALRPLIRLYGPTAAADFGPLKLQTLRDEALKPYERPIIDHRTHRERILKCSGWSRRVANQNVGRIRTVFKWAVSREMIPGSIYQALLTVSPLEKGKSAARELPKVKPARQADIDKVLPLLPPPVRAMVELEALTGMRPGEVCAMRGADLTTPADGPWVYRPAHHKTENHDIDRVIYIGPRGKELLAPLLRVGFIFSPRESDTWRRERAAKARTSKPTPMQLKARAEAAKRFRYADRYNSTTYYRAVTYACKAAGLDEHFGPNRLRHLAATTLRARFGLDAAQAILGHTSSRTTEGYAERDTSAAARVMAEIG